MDGLLLHRTRRFFPPSIALAETFARLTALTHGRMTRMSVWVNTGIVANPDIRRARRMLILLMWPSPLSQHSHSVCREGKQEMFTRTHVVTYRINPLVHWSPPAIHQHKSHIIPRGGHLLGRPPSGIRRGARLDVFIAIENASYRRSLAASTGTSDAIDLSNETTHGGIRVSKGVWTSPLLASDPP